MFKPLKDTLSHVAEPFSSLKEWSQDGMQKRSHVNVLFLLLFFIAWWHVPFSLNVLFYRVYEFREGSIEDRHHLGLKGAYLCEIAKYATHSWDVLGLIALMLSPTIPSIHCWCFRQHLPVPAGFIVTSEACQDFFSLSRSAGLSPHLQHNLHQAVAKIEKKTGKSFQNSPLPQPQPSTASHMTTGLSKVSPPLLLSVRSSTGVNHPGLTDTILNLGINDKTCELLAKHANNSM